MSIIPEIKEGQSIELLKALHILTRDGKINQDTRRKLKQVYHLYQFIEPLMNKVIQTYDGLNIVDHGAGKSYLGFILYDLYLKNIQQGHVYGIETREDLVKSSQELADRLGFDRMSFLNMLAQDTPLDTRLPQDIHIVTALHACDTATDAAIRFALTRKAPYMVIVPCCQAQIAAYWRSIKSQALSSGHLSEVYRHPLHTREMGSHITNVLRCLQLEAHGYKVTVTELVGWEHSMKNELIIAQKVGSLKRSARERQLKLMKDFELMALKDEFAYDIQSG